MRVMDSSKIRSRVWVEVNLDTLEENFNKIRTAVDPAKVLAVLKANAYGLGVEKIAERLNRAGAAGFCVAELKEALPLIRFGKPVQILGGVLDYEIPEAVAHGIILGITDMETAKKSARRLSARGKPQSAISNSIPAWGVSAFSRKMPSDSFPKS